MLGWFTLSGILLAIILVPFFLFGDVIEARMEPLFRDSPSTTRWVLGGVGAVALATDILLPIPSSLVSSGCGMALGFPIGAAVSLVGMMAGCWLGYMLGGTAGRKTAEHLVGGVEIHRLETAWKRYGDWALVLFRPIPVLAEASVLFAGMSRMSVGRFTLLMLLSNLGVSIVYAAVGAYAAEVESFLLAFAASVILPGAAMLAVRKMGGGKGKGASG